MTIARQLPAYLRALCLVLIITGGLGMAQAQRFYCTGELILCSSPDADSSRFYKINTDESQGGSITFEEFSDKPGPYINAIGYSNFDNYIYGISANSLDLCRLDASGNVITLRHLHEFNSAKTYNAGAITPDGRFLIVLSSRSGTPPFKNLEMIRINLQSDEFDLEISPLKTLSGEDVSTLDIAFHPQSGALFGYDGLNGRLLEISPGGAIVDDLKYPTSGNIDLMAALFFDAWGNLFGYGRERGQLGISSFYKIDVNTGSTQLLQTGPLALASDGCSCPYRLELLKSVEPNTTVACSEVSYRFKIINATGLTQSAVRFEDQLPKNFSFIDIQGNIFGGTPEGLGTGRLVISDMTIPPGTDSFDIRVAIGEVSPGRYRNQAALRNLSLLLGGSDLSDDPSSFVLNDSTDLDIILSSNLSTIDSTVYICPGDTLTLDVSFLTGVFSYSWNTGQTSSAIDIWQAGTYDLIAENACQSMQLIFDVRMRSPDHVLELGPDITVPLGQEVVITPLITGIEMPILQWSLFPESDSICKTCDVQSFYPTTNASCVVVATDLSGCTFTDTLRIIVDKQYPVYAPNIFSPNNDGINDLFNLSISPAAIVKKLSIYDRWGNHVFETSGNETIANARGWDGTYSGQPAQPGVYIWIARLVYIDGEVRNYSGDVTVIR